MRNRKLSEIAFLLIFALIFSLIFPGFPEQVFARDGPTNADVELYVHGEKSTGGPIFNTAGDMGGSLWAPGVSDSGIIRIYNNYSNRVSIHNLGIKLRLHSTITGENVSDPQLIKEFAEAMRLVIRKGSFLVFENTICRKSFYELLYSKENPEQRGYELGILDRISIGKDSSVDLEYTVQMSGDAGNNLQGLKATVDFIVNLQEDPYENPPDDNEDEKDDKDDKDDEESNGLVEEPLEKIPDIGGHWAHDCIVALIEHDVLEPDANGSVRPEDFITRAEAAVLMGKALKLKESKLDNSGYVDSVPSWAKGYIIAASEAKVFKGYPGRLFKASNSISREEMTAVLIRAFRADSTSSIKLDFNDEHRIAEWSRGNVARSVEEGIVTGYAVDNTFRPKAYMTRAEAFTIVCKLLGYHKEHNKQLSWNYQL